MIRTANFRKIFERAGAASVVVNETWTLDESLRNDRYFLNLYPSQGFIRYIPKDARAGGL